MLTTKQKELLQAIEWFINENGYSPTVRELGKMLGNSSPGTIQSKLFELERKKYISTVPGKFRTIKVLRSCNE